MPDTELVNIKIDGIALQAPKGESVIEAAKRVNIDIPFFCYHPRLSMAEGGANCRMCLVDVAMPRKNPDGTVVVAKMPKPQTACSLPVAEGMEVMTESEQVVKDRKGILEFLLINHPLDCPICDRGGECPLQNNTLHYGPPTTRFIEEKRHFPKAFPLSKYVVLDRERCIHCARCTRFTRDVSGDNQLDFLFRGADMELATFAHTEFQSKFSGNVIEICPVGALLSRTYRFKARPWDLLTQKSICNRCSNGCNIKIDYRVRNIQRVNARENDYVNEEWTCDKGKFGMDYLSSDERLTQPLVRQGDAFVPISWDDANRLMLEKIEAAGGQIGGIGGAHAANEDLYAWQKFFREQLGVNNLDHRMGPHFPPTSSGLFARFGYHTMGQSIASLEDMKTILVFGSNLVDEQPILFLRVRKAWRFKGASVVEAVPRPADYEQYPNHVGEFASVRLHYKPGSEVALVNGLLHVLFEDGLLSGGNGTEGAVGNVDAFKSAIDVSQWTADRAAQECGVEADAIRRAARLLATNRLSILAGCDVTHHPHMDDVLKALGNLAVITGNAGRLNLPVTEVNQQGAMDLGILPDSLPGYAPAPNPGMNTEQMLKAAATGELKLLWLLGGDLVNEYHDPELARRALEGSPFTIVHALTLSDTAKMADLVLPVQSLAEREGTFTNVERRVQRFWRCFEYAPEIKADWTIFTQLSGLRGNVMPFFTARDVLREIAAKVPNYKDCGPRQLGDLGVRWEYPSGEAPEARVERVAYAPAGAPK